MVKKCCSGEVNGRLSGRGMVGGKCEKEGNDGKKLKGGREAQRGGSME
jgi:hypothetical protein